MGVRLLLRRHCASHARVAEALAVCGVVAVDGLDLADDADLAALLGAGMGVALMPASATLPAGIFRVPLEDIALTRELRLWAVQGRRREPAAALLATQLRAADWSAYEAAAATA